MIDQLLEQAAQHCHRLPEKGTPAAELTERDRLALASAAGVPVEFEFDGTHVTMRSKVPFAITDQGDGGWIVISLAQKEKP